MARMARPPVLPLYKPRELFTMPVSYLPSQIDGGASSTPLNFRDSPFKLLWADIKLVASLLLWVPHIFLPIRSTNRYSELYMSRENMRDLFIHCVLGLLGIIFLIIAVPLAIAAPGGAFWLFVGLYYGIVWILCIKLRGPRVVYSRFNLDGYAVKPEENWVFINGVAAGEHWLQENIDMLSSIFKRPVVGVHNQTYGTVFDLMECLVQRCFSYSTEDTRIIYQHLKAVLMNNEITKVVVIAHSQGGIILSTALDSLFADVPSDAFDKLEIYTFGCAANHFNNPVRYVPTPPSTTSSEYSTSVSSFATDSQTTSAGPPKEERLIRHIEHYANEHDFVALFGVLHFTRDKLSNRFVGKVFENKGHGGHLMNQHYLDRMFVDEASGFLDQVVEIDENTAMQREEEAGLEGALNRTEVEARATHGENVAHGTAEAVGVRIDASRSVRTLGTVRTRGTMDARRSVERQRGKTVRDLSRLWRYKDGHSPQD
ncbi:hypothetical protein P167DRAFT_499627 [Morchella conica CCBAS932]|uniref:DUF676 domain-containing protein n=1 Tax=Morchella conica CCBAS932 TaxID=1392247 RepID=A0A3N4L2C1_9PEZI|nr:hypothetical protein P167DRAFT_499627 [Morchella conica CCBAS932]